MCCLPHGARAYLRVQRRSNVVLGQQGGKMKNPPCQSAWRVSETFWELFSLFSSFLRGASCPKSPRVAAAAAPPFMLEKEGHVKGRRTLKLQGTTYWLPGASNGRW